jgi:hypothetical protein
MNIFKTISDTLGSLFHGKSPEGVNKNDILNLVDNNLVLLNTVVTTFDTNNSEVIKYIQNTLMPANNTNKDNTEQRKLYGEYFKALAPAGRRLETQLILSSIRAAAAIAITDHEKIRDNFTTLFNQGTDVSEVQLNQMKLSHAAIFGYINLSALMCDWFCFFYTSIIGRSADALRVPPYREKVIQDNGKTVASFVSDIVGRGPTKGLLDVIASIRSKGDVALYSDAATLDTYANINDYPGAMKLFGSFNIGLPFLFIRDLFVKRAHDQYKRNVAMREWMITKTAILQMDLANVDPNSPEYQRLLAVLSKYSDEIARLDAAIDKYMNS